MSFRFAQFAFGFSLFLAAFTAHAADFVPPTLTASVVDQVGIYSEGERESLQGALSELLQKTGVQMAVLVPTSLQGLEIEEYSIKVVEAWKLGDKNTRQGLLFVLAPNERKMRLEVGYGLEGDIPDARSKQLLDDYVRPYLKQNQIFGGTRVLIGEVARLKGATLSGAEPARPVPSRGQAGGSHFPLLLILFVVFILFRISPLGTVLGLLGGGRGGWGGGGGGWGGGGGGGFSGGGGSFGGGGASSDW